MPFVCGLLLFGAGGIAVFGGFAGPSIQQPIPFNHKAHIDDGQECNECHEFVEEERFASIPDLEVCLTCHEDPITNSPAEKLIHAYAEAGEEIPWVRLFRVPGHVYYSHRRHVGIAKLDCTNCHGDIGTSTAPPSTRPRQLDMDDCIDCHSRENASTDCTSCHK